MTGKMNGTVGYVLCPGGGNGYRGLVAV